MDYLSFSKKEWEVLVCFWAVDEPLCCTEFSERFGLNRNTSLSVIRKLVNKGILEIASFGSSFPTSRHRIGDFAKWFDGGTNF